MKNIAMRHGLSLLVLAIHQSWSGVFFASANVFADASSNSNSSSTVDTAVESPPSSNVFVHGEHCGTDLVLCAQAQSCFDHDDGCGETGSSTIAECSFVMDTCQFCFPHSRCGSSSTEPSATDHNNRSATFVGETPECGPALALCASAGPCFDHEAACLADGSVLAGDCDAALPCKPCFPYSRCGGDGSSNYPIKDAAVEIHQSALFVESDRCGPELAVCENGGPCFDHTQGCQEDGSVDTTLEGLENCQLALDFCIPCFPNSRCGGAKEQEGEPEQDDDKDEGEELQDTGASGEDKDEGVGTQDDEASALLESDASVVAFRTTAPSSTVLWIVSLGIYHLLQVA